MSLAPGLELPAPSPDAQPAFTDAAGCSEWLQTLPLINVGPSHGRLLGELEELNACELPAQERARILELLREPVIFVQGEHAKKFTSRAIPIAAPEREIFTNVVALWEAMATGWLHCLDTALAGASGTAAQAALACQRALWCLGQKMAEHFRVFREVEGDEWRRVHVLYRLAESNGFADLDVSHPAYKEGEIQTSCADTFVQILLVALANPNEHTARQQALIARWTESWARKVPLSEDPPADTGQPPLNVDLDAPQGALRSPRQGPGVRYLHVDEVGKGLRKRLALLRSGESPESLGLGSDVPPGLAGRMLATLYGQWCEDRKARQQARRPAVRVAELCQGIAAMHYYVTGKAFSQPAAVTTELSQRQREEIATFGRTSSREEEKFVAAAVAALERWSIRDESLSGFRLERTPEDGRNRFMHDQLVAVRPADARVFMLATVRWLSVGGNFELRMGTRLLPGVPQGIAIRPTGINVMNEKFVPALALPAVPALQSVASLILPLGWYRARRVIEVYTDRLEKFLLTGLVERGHDFERCTYEPAP